MSDTALQTAEIGVIAMAVMGSNLARNMAHKGFRVAIAEQMEDPAEARKRGAKSVVARDVVRLVTPGTLTEESLLEARRHNFLAAFAVVREDSALAWVDISTGEFRVMPCPEPRLAPELARLAPREVLACEPALRDLAAMAEADVTAAAALEAYQAAAQIIATADSASTVMNSPENASRAKRCAASTELERSSTSTTGSL